MNLAFAPTVRLSLPLVWEEATAPMRDSMRERTEVLHGLQRGQTMTLEQPAGHEVSCQRGRVRITRVGGDGGGGDGNEPGTVLGAGETYRPEGDGALLICALDDSLVWSSSLGGIRAAVISRRS